MERIDVKEFIITCEACGNVKNFMVKSEQDAELIFKQFSCENKCGRNLYSFITVGTLKRN